MTIVRTTSAAYRISQHVHCNGCGVPISVGVRCAHCPMPAVCQPAPGTAICVWRRNHQGARSVLFRSEVRATVTAYVASLHTKRRTYPLQAWIAREDQPATLR